MLIQTALKEWAVAVEALAQGEMLLLLRKGGIREEKGRFAAEAQRVVLFPTFEHQKPALLKPKYQTAVTAVAPGWHPETIQFPAWADITHIFQTHDAEKVAALSAYHIWQPQLPQARLKWKAKQPLYVLALRAYAFPSPIERPWQPVYGGCRSWLTLDTGIDVDEATAVPAMTDADYDRQVTAIARLLTEE